MPYGWGASQKAYEKAKSDYKAKTGYSTVGEKIAANRNNNTNQSNKDQGGINNVVKDFFDKGKAENVITGNDFASDLKKASNYLYTQHPYAQELKNKYNLSDQDIISLRMGMTMPGFQNKIKDVYDKKIKPGLPQSYNIGYDYAVDKYYKPGMKPSDFFNPYEKGTFQSGAYNFVNTMPFMKGVNALFGSPQGQAGMYYARNQLGLEGDEMNKFAGAVANTPELYNYVMDTPLMRDYKFDQFVYDVRRENPIGGGGNKAITPVQEPTVAGYNAIYNPYLPANYTGISAFG